MEIIDCQQLSEQWYEARLGMPTASNFNKIVDTKGNPSKQRTKYMYQLAGEYITGVPEDTYQNYSMIRGVEMEAEARQFYEMVKGVNVQEVGFVSQMEYGCSPDGLVSDDGLIQIKCPSLAVHVEYLLDGKTPKSYFQQIQGEMYVTDRKWNDFVSYYPGIKPLIHRNKRDEAFISKLDAELKRFVKELKETIKKLGE